MHFFNENIWISIKISLKFVPKGPINNISALVHIMAWRRLGDKPLFEPKVVSLPTHICFTRPQWVKVCIYDWWSQNINCNASRYPTAPTRDHAQIVTHMFPIKHPGVSLNWPLQVCRDKKSRHEETLLPKNKHILDNLSLNLNSYIWVSFLIIDNHCHINLLFGFIKNKSHLTYIHRILQVYFFTSRDKQTRYEIMAWMSKLHLQEYIQGVLVLISVNYWKGPKR